MKKYDVAISTLGIEVLSPQGGNTVVLLITEGDSLPKSGTLTFYAGQTLSANTNASLNIKLREADALSPISKSRFVGTFKIVGTDMDAGTVPKGARLDCTYEITDSGVLYLEVNLPCIDTAFCMHTMLWHEETADIDCLAEDSRQMLAVLEGLPEYLYTPELAKARNDLLFAANLDSLAENTPEDVQKASGALSTARQLLCQIRKIHLPTMRQLELCSCMHAFERLTETYATPNERDAFAHMAEEAKQALGHEDASFENILDNLRNLHAVILLRQDWFVIDWYRQITTASFRFRDISRYKTLKRLGDAALQADNIDSLRQILIDLLALMRCPALEDGIEAEANILKG